MVENLGKLKLSLCVNWVLPEHAKEALLLGRDRQQNKHQIASLSIGGVLYGSKHSPFCKDSGLSVFKAGPSSARIVWVGKLRMSQCSG